MKNDQSSFKERVNENFKDAKQGTTATKESMLVLFFLFAMTGLVVVNTELLGFALRFVGGLLTFFSTYLMALLHFFVEEE